ncbi:hypothetical protein SISSUDRAFT_833125 [Sistotremastrum suecicum HHB10207 ss-3]|uniref:C2H2-type domain-containing protein n=1 Tax=Sistotremastrum suecicum HHB10207 ss-3 TaxID=1314776 RepID=A0A166CLP4_9AGAM|nr:hypothetical protein SISSUDRAFT_833125 [Sistotremastrum suecicum HHB10207 ss-3]
MSNFADTLAPNGVPMFADAYTSFKDSRFGHYGSQDGDLQESVHSMYSQYSQIKAFNRNTQASWSQPDVISPYIVDSPVDDSSMSTPDLSRGSTPGSSVYIQDGSHDCTPFSSGYFSLPYITSEPADKEQNPLAYSSHSACTSQSTTPSDSFPPSTITPFGGDYHSAAEFGLAPFQESDAEIQDQPQLFLEFEGGMYFADGTDPMFSGSGMVNTNGGFREGDVGVDLSAHLDLNTSTENYEDIFDGLFTSEPTPPIVATKTEDVKPIAIPSLLSIPLSQPRIEVATFDHEMDFEGDVASSPSSDSPFPSPIVRPTRKANKAIKVAKVTQKSRRGRVPIKNRRLEASPSAETRPPSHADCEVQKDHSPQPADPNNKDRKIPLSVEDKLFWRYRLPRETANALREHGIPKHWLYRRRFGPCPWTVDGQPCGKSKAKSSGDYGRHIEGHANKILKRSLSCDYGNCGKSFSRIDAVKRHMDKCHGRNSKSRKLRK